MNKLTIEYIKLRITGTNCWSGVLRSFKWSTESSHTPSTETVSRPPNPDPFSEDVPSLFPSLKSSHHRPRGTVTPKVESTRGETHEEPRRWRSYVLWRTPGQSDTGYSESCLNGRPIFRSYGINRLKAFPTSVTPPGTESTYPHPRTRARSQGLMGRLVLQVRWKLLNE